MNIFRRLFADNFTGRNKVWTQRDGTQCRIRDIKDSHLLNIQRLVSCRHPLFDEIEAEIKRRGLSLSAATFDFIGDGGIGVFESDFGDQ